jgi:hypothetical protein
VDCISFEELTAYGMTLYSMASPDTTCSLSSFHRATIHRAQIETAAAEPAQMPAVSRRLFAAVSALCVVGRSVWSAVGRGLDR